MDGSEPERVEEVGLLFVLGSRLKHFEVGEVIRDILYYRILKTEPAEKNYFHDNFLRLECNFCFYFPHVSNFFLFCDRSSIQIQ